MRLALSRIFLLTWPRSTLDSICFAYTLLDTHHSRSARYRVSSSRPAWHIARRSHISGFGHRDFDEMIKAYNKSPGRFILLSGFPPWKSAKKKRPAVDNGTRCVYNCSRLIDCLAGMRVKFLRLFILYSTLSIR